MSGQAESIPRTGTSARSSRPTGIVWGLAAVTVWSGSFVLTRLGVKTTLNAYDLTALRFGFAAGILLPIVCKEGLAVARLGWTGLVVLIAGAGAPYALLIALGLRFAPASQAAALVPGPMSVMAALLGAAILRERLSARSWWGAGSILLGSLLIAGFADGASEGPAAFLLAALLWAGYVIVLRRARLSARHATAIVAVGSAALYLPTYIALLPHGLARAPPADIAVQAIYQGGLTTVLGLFAFNRAVTLLGAAAGAALPALVPVITLAMAALLLHEMPGPSDLAAACLIGAGVLLVTRETSTDEEKHMTRPNVAIASSRGEAIGYSRAIRAGDLIFVSGTTASGPDGKALHPGDVRGQATVILERILAALNELGAGPQHIVETRIYLTDMATWQDVGRAHGAVFKTVRPATTMVQVGPLIAPDLLVEISAVASLAAV